MNRHEYRDRTISFPRRGPCLGAARRHRAARDDVLPAGLPRGQLADLRRLHQRTSACFLRHPHVSHVAVLHHRGLLRARAAPTARYGRPHQESVAAHRPAVDRFTVLVDAAHHRRRSSGRDDSSVSAGSSRHGAAISGRGPPVPWGHLWFLYLLLVLYSLVLLAARVVVRLDANGVLRASVAGRARCTHPHPPGAGPAGSARVAASLLRNAVVAQWQGIPAPILGLVPNFRRCWRTAARSSLAGLYIENSEFLRHARDRLAAVPAGSGPGDAGIHLPRRRQDSFRHAAAGWCRTYRFRLRVHARLVVLVLRGDRWRVRYS